MNESYLQHYGVKGMKWGVRRKRSEVSNRQQRKSSKLIDRKKYYANRNIAEVNRRQKAETKYFEPYIKGSDKKMASAAKDLAVIGKKHFDAVIAQEEIYKKKLSAIDVKQTSYREVKRLIRSFEDDYQIDKNMAEVTYFRERNELTRKYA